MNSKQTMLIVDDMDVNRAAIAAAFFKEYHILFAENGKEAIDVIQKNSKNISVILLDIIMPVMDGIKVLQWMKQREYHSIPIIAITADESDQVKALENGATDFISNPTNSSVIRARIKNVLGRFWFEKEQHTSASTEKTKLEIDNLVNSIPGGIAIYKFTDHFETVYFSDGVAALSGHTREEYANDMQGDASKIIYSEDKKRAYDAIIKALKNNESIDITYRIHHKNGGLVWVRMNAIPMSKEEDGYLIHAVFQRSEQMSKLYDNLVNESSSAIYVSNTSTYELLYMNKKGLQLVGRSKKFEAGQKCYEFLFNRTSPCEFCKIHLMQHDQFMERDFPYSRSGSIYHLRGKLTDWNGIEAHVEYIEEVTQSRVAEQKNKELTEQLSSVIEHVPGGMCLYIADKNGIKPLVHNHAFFEIFGYSTEYINSINHKTNYLNVHPDDLAELQAKIDKAIKTSTPINHTYRIFHDRKQAYIWVYLNCMIIDQPDGTKLCYVSNADVTEERKVRQQLLRAKNDMQELMKKEEEALKSYQALVNTVPGGIAQYEVDGNKVKTSFYSDGLCALSGYTRAERELLCRNDAMALTYKEDVPLLRQTVENAIQNRSNIDLTYRISTKSGAPRWVHLLATYSGIDGKKAKFHAVFSDIDEIKKMEESSKEQQLRYEVALKSAGINVWEYDIRTDVLTVISNSSRIKQNCFTIPNYISSTVQNGYVREDSLEAFYSIFEQLKSGKKEVNEDIWYKTTDKDGWWCERVIYTTVFDEKGVPVKAFGAGRDVTREKEAIQKFQEEMSYRAALQESNIDSLKINLTQNTIIDGDSPFAVLDELIDGNDADRYFSKTAEYIRDDKRKEEYRKAFTRHALLERFNREDYSVSMEFARTFDTDRIYWIKYNVHLMKNPESKDVIAFVVSNDITDEKVRQEIMDTIAKTEYEFFIVVDGTTNSAVDYTINSGRKLFSEEQAFEQRNEMLIRQVVCEEDVERVVNECRICNVFEHIESGTVHKLDFNMREDNGEIRRKQLQLTLIDRDRKAYLMTRIDVTGVYDEQIKYQKELEQALVFARQASLAKSDFLARMSHDIRTPLNAVIGLSGLGATSDSMEEMRKYHQQIGASGEYLLAIINDVLDMSKITSNAVVLNPSVVCLPQFIRDTIDIVRPTIEAKNICFEMKTQGITSAYVRLDETHVRQVAVNLLSNAIKFTPENGHIELCLENISRSGKFVKNRMMVRDNGCGISKEFLPKLFLPFEQENTANDKARAGTGLGLAIVKSIVDLMGGTIRVESEKGKGSTFIIEWELETVEEIQAKQLEPTSQAEMLENRRVLLCEDHPLNAQIAIKLLERKEMIVDHAANGQSGLEMFQNSGVNYYDAILMDIRMPVMDGIAAAQSIRKLDRSDAKTIPIIAMTANAFAEDVEKTKNGGMNAHLAKPIDPKMLFQELNRLIFTKSQLSKMDTAPPKRAKEPTHE